MPVALVCKWRETEYNQANGQVRCGSHMVHVIEGTNEVKCECLMWIWGHEGTPQGETHASVSYLVPQSLSRKENRKALREGGIHPASTILLWNPSRWEELQESKVN